MNRNCRCNRRPRAFRFSEGWPVSQLIERHEVAVAAAVSINSLPDISRETSTSADGLLRELIGSPVLCTGRQQRRPVYNS